MGGRLSRIPSESIPPREIEMPRTRRVLVPAPVAPLATGLALAADPPSTSSPAAQAPTADDPALQKEAAAYLASVTTLADDKMEGRGLDTKGILLAENYIEKQLKSAGLKPGFGNSYRQKFPVKIGVEKLAGNAI